MTAEELVTKLAKSCRESFAKLLASDLTDADVQTAFEPVIGRNDLDARGVAALRFQLLRFLVDDARALGAWETVAAAAPAIDRDARVLAVWKKVANDDWHELGSETWPLRYYEDKLYDWFLSRFDPGKAREVVRSGLWPRQAHGVLLALVLGLLVLAHFYASSARWLWLSVPAAYVAILLCLGWTFARPSQGPKADRTFVEGFLLAANSLAPRLGAAVLVGLVGVGSFSSVPRWGSAGPGLAASVAVLVAGGLYLAVQMARKVQPRGRGLLRRWWAVGACGLSHSLALTAVGLTALRQIAHQTDAATAEIFSWAVWSLAMGLVLNVIWDETPVTQAL